MYAEAFVDGVAKELEGAREEGDELLVAEVHAHDLSEFMKTLLQRFTRWFDREHNRRGTERYKSVIVESGAAARTIAACIGLNPVRAGMVNDPVDYRWSSYSEAVGGGAKGNGKKAREELVRACMSLKGVSFEAEKWKEVSRICRRAMGLALGRRSGSIGTCDQERGRDVVFKGQCDGLAGSWDGGDIEETGEVFHGWSGDREQGVCERGVRGLAGEVYGEEE